MTDPARWRWPSSWPVIAPDQTAPGGIDDHAVILRICAREAPAGTRIEITRWPLGGLQVGASVPAGVPSWPVRQRIARQLALVGWHTQVSSDQVVVLGWSAPGLSHRGRLMRAALAGRLTDMQQTARWAVERTIAHADEFVSVVGGPHRLDGGHAGVIAEEVCQRLCTLLRWPHRLADLDGFQRTSQLRDLQMLLAQVSGLEEQLRQSCRDHLIVTRLLSLATWERLAQGQDRDRARWQVLAEARTWLLASDLAARGGWRAQTSPQGRVAGLTERHVGASVPNHACPRPGTGWR